MPTFVLECKQLIGMVTAGGAAQATGHNSCFDASGAMLRHETNGVVADCASAKATRLCERDPKTAEIVCPVTCALGCGAAHTASLQERFETLAETCAHMPVWAMLEAIAHAHCLNAKL